MGSTTARKAFPSRVTPKTGPVSYSRRAATTSFWSFWGVLPPDTNLGFTVKSTPPMRWSCLMMVRMPDRFPRVNGVSVRLSHCSESAGMRSTVWIRLFTYFVTQSISIGIFSFFSHLARATVLASSFTRPNSGDSLEISSYNLLNQQLP